MVGICTKDRPDELRRCLTSLAADYPGLEVLVVDASGDDASSAVCAELTGDLMSITRVRAVPGLAAQRNAVLDHAEQRRADLLLCVDDDVVVEQGFVAAMLAAAEESPEVAAIGALVVDEPLVRLVAFKSAFLLWSRTPGRVLRSGRNVIGHAAGGPWPRRVEWLSTCAIVLRPPHVRGLRFDERLQGYSYGEDLDFTFRLSRLHPLTVCRTARVQHLLSPSGRPDPRGLARRRTELLHAWVGEQRANGLSTAWFWWSVLGEIALETLGAIAGRAQSRATLRGVLDGSIQVLRHGSSRGAVEVENVRT
jgi:GT2 family glycosyltransferase